MEPTSAAGIQDQFLNLLTTQLRHQDPLEPTKQEDFIAQLAQFSTLEGIEKLNDNFSDFMTTQLDQNSNVAGQQFKEMASAAELVGAKVAYSTGDEQGDATSGVVQAVVLQDDAIHLRIDGDLVRLDNIHEIGSRFQVD